MPCSLSSRNVAFKRNERHVESGPPELAIAEKDRCQITIDRAYWVHTEPSGPTSGRFTPLKHGDKLAYCDGLGLYHPLPSARVMVPASRGTRWSIGWGKWSWEGNSDSRLHVSSSFLKKRVQFLCLLFNLPVESLIFQGWVGWVDIWSAVTERINLN